MNLPLAIFMRHGQADNNVNRILVGRYIESHLTEYGKQQVADTAKYLKNVPIEKVYVSPVIKNGGNCKDCLQNFRDKL